VTSEQRLSDALRVVADHTDTPPPPVAELIRRGRRRRRDRILARSLVAAAVVAAVGGATALTVSVLGPEPVGITAAPVDVASGPEATGDTSFRYTQTGQTSSGRILGCAGAVDPGAEMGWEKGTSTDRYEIRFVDAVQYVKEAGRPWRAEPRSPFERSFSCPVSVASTTVDPVVVVRSLREQGTVEYTGRTGKGPDAVDAYTYTYSMKKGLLTYSGTVEAGVASRKVQKVTLNLSGDGQDNSFTTVYSGFGEPVRVTAPKV
jgi:hypothetical protein